MSFKLPRLGGYGIVDPSGKPLSNFQGWINQAFAKIEKGITDLGTALGLIATAQSTADAANAAAATAHAEAIAAQVDADAANADLANIASDSILSPVEKKRVIADVNDLNNEKTDIDSKATAASITTEKTNYDNSLSALNTYLAGLTSPVAWNNISGDTTIVGTTFRSNFSDTYLKRQLLLNAIDDKARQTATWTTVSGTGKPADNATKNIVTYASTAPSSPTDGDIWIDTTTGVYVIKVRVSGAWQIGANNTTNTNQLTGTALSDGSAIRNADVAVSSGNITGIGTGNNTPVANSFVGVGQNQIANSSFTHSGNPLYAWTTGWNGDSGLPTTWDVNLSGWCGALNVAYVTLTGTPAVGKFFDGHIHLPNTEGTALKNAQRWALAVTDGDRVFGSALLGIHRLQFAIVEVQWLDATGVYLGETTLGTGGRAFGGANGDPANFDRVGGFAAAPTGARYAFLNVRGDTDGGANPYMFYTQMMLCKVPAGQTQWPPYNEGPADRSATFGADLATNVTNNTHDWVLDGSTYGRVRLTYLNSNRPVINFADGFHSNQQLDYISDGSTYARIRGSELSSGTHRLGVAGSGYRLGDMRNVPAISGQGARYKYTGTISFTSTAGSGTATISTTAGSSYVGSNTINYSAMSVGVSGSTGTTVTYYLYLDDPNYAGGSQTLVATTTGNNVYQNDGRVWIGSIDVTFPVSGGGTGTGGGGGGGGFGCVTVDTFLPGFGCAGDVRVGDELLVVNPVTFAERYGVVSYAQRKMQPCVRITTDSGITLECSTSAPIAIEGGELVCAPDLLGHNVPVCDAGKYGHEEVVSVEHIGEQEIMHITCENDLFLAGAQDGRYLIHHNLKP